MENNAVTLCGTLAGAPVFSHESRMLRFYRLPLEVERLSGAVDRLNVLVREPQLTLLELGDRTKLRVQGEVRSFNNRSGDGARLIVTVLARSLELCDGYDSNLVELRGTLCKPPKLRCTPMGRDICDLLLAVNRRGGRSDYLPCICWGSRAREAALWTVGTVVRLEGRFQSRDYIKLCDEGPEQHTAYEVSASLIEAPVSVG
jgi:primosomal replication protein N